MSEDYKNFDAADEIDLSALKANEDHNNEKRYKERDIIKLDLAGNYYSNHVTAMTSESLHSKSDIAAELGYRDMLIDQLKRELDLSVKALSIFTDPNTDVSVKITDRKDLHQ